jgi:hypothetical protein
MKLYGVLYEDFSGDAGTGINSKLYKSVDQASYAARSCADENVLELNNMDDDDEYGPYKVKSLKMGNGLFAFKMVDKTGNKVEGFSVVEFEVDL